MKIKMARLTTLNSQKDDSAVQKPIYKQSKLIESNQVGKHKEQHLIFNPKDLAQLEDLEVDNQAENLNL